MEGLTNRDTRVRSAIEAGDLHTCALPYDGTIRCWGRGGDGRLGNGSTADALRPVPVDDITTAVAVSGGELHTCALLVGGTDPSNQTAPMASSERTLGNLRAVQKHRRHQHIQTTTIYTRLTQHELQQVVSVFDSNGKGVLIPPRD